MKATKENRSNSLQRNIGGFTYSDNGYCDGLPGLQRLASWPPANVHGNK